MLVGTVSVYSHYLIRSMKAFNSLAMVTSTTIVIKSYMRGTSSFKELSGWQALVGKKEFPVQTNSGGTATA
jgi:hypothetical protein